MTRPSGSARLDRRGQRRPGFRHGLLTVEPPHAELHARIAVADHRGQDKGGFYTFEATPKDLPPSTFRVPASLDAYHGSIVVDWMAPRAADGSAAYIGGWRFLLGRGV